MRRERQPQRAETVEHALRDEGLASTYARLAARVSDDARRALGLEDECAGAVGGAQTLGRQQAVGAEQPLLGKAPRAGLGGEGLEAGGRGGGGAATPQGLARHRDAGRHAQRAQEAGGLSRLELGVHGDLLQTGLRFCAKFGLAWPYGLPAASTTKRAMRCDSSST